MRLIEAGTTHTPKPRRQGECRCEREAPLAETLSEADVEHAAIVRLIECGPLWRIEMKVSFASPSRQCRIAARSACPPALRQSLVLPEGPIATRAPQTFRTKKRDIDLLSLQALDQITGQALSSVRSLAELIAKRAYGQRNDRMEKRCGVAPTEETPARREAARPRSFECEIILRQNGAGDLQNAFTSLCHSTPSRGAGRAEH